MSTPAANPVPSSAPQSSASPAPAPATELVLGAAPEAARESAPEPVIGSAAPASPFRITRRVEFGDTDMAGIMHFANFFRFMEAAETAFLRSKGLSVMWTADGQRLGFPRVSASCDFRKPARFEDELTIAVTVEKIGRRSISYRFDFTRGREAIAVGRATAVYCRTTVAHQMESQDIPESLRQLLLSES